MRRGPQLAGGGGGDRLGLAGHAAERPIADAAEAEFRAAGRGVPADAMMVAEPTLLRIPGRGYVEGAQEQLAIVGLDLDRTLDRPRVAAVGIDRHPPGRQ